MIQRKDTIGVNVGSLIIGGGAPISLQTMTKTKTDDFDATLDQIIALAEAGSDLIRIAVTDEPAADAFKHLVRESPVPLIADIHFDVKLALLSLEYGAAKVRINPGNLGGKGKMTLLAGAAADAGAALRIGVNAGSLEKKLLKKHGGATPQALVESALGHLEELERHGFQETIVSLKSSSVLTTIAANRLFARHSNYPLHLGITEGGPMQTGVVKAAVGIGALLAEGIGDTIRVSLTAHPLEEVKTGRMILKSLELGKPGPVLISCPTCSRCEVDLLPLVEQVEEILLEISRPLTVAVMGCAVNGPGEAREADIGVSAGRKKGIIFSNGIVVKTVEQRDIMKALKKEIYRRIENEK